jgi:hypothetical protein
MLVRGEAALDTGYVVEREVLRSERTVVRDEHLGSQSGVEFGRAHLRPRARAMEVTPGHDLPHERLEQRTRVSTVAGSPITALLPGVITPSGMATDHRHAQPPQAPPARGSGRPRRRWRPRPVAPAEASHLQSVVLGDCSSLRSDSERAAGRIQRRSPALQEGHEAVHDRAGDHRPCEYEPHQLHARRDLATPLRVCAPGSMRDCLDRFVLEVKNCAPR